LFRKHKEKKLTENTLRREKEYPGAKVRLLQRDGKKKQDWEG